MMWEDQRHQEVLKAEVAAALRWDEGADPAKFLENLDRAGLKIVTKRGDRQIHVAPYCYLCGDAADLVPVRDDRHKPLYWLCGLHSKDEANWALEYPVRLSVEPEVTPAAFSGHEANFDCPADCGSFATPAAFSAFEHDLDCPDDCGTTHSCNPRRIF